MTRNAALLITMLILVAGCQVDQNKEVETYRRVLDIDASGAATAQPQHLTLRGALLLANHNNENLGIRGEDYLRALIDRRRAVANFLPTVNFGATQDARARGTSGGASVGGGGSSNSQTHALDVFGSLDWNLFNGFQDVHRYWRDTFVIAQRRNDLLSFQELLLLDVATIYYQILRAEASVRVLENSVRVQEERLRDTRGRLRAGVARPLDVAQTEAQVSATRNLLISARRDVQNARELLVLFTGAPVLDSELDDSFDLPPQIETLDAYLEVSRAARLDLAASAAAITAARHQVEAAFGQYYPSVSLNLTGFLYRESVPTARDWEALLTANLPIFSAGRIQADVREAWSFFREALLVQSYLQRQVAQQVAEAYHDLDTSEASIAELRVRLAAAAEAYRQADASYRVGLATNLERVAAQDALLDAQLQLTNQEYERKVDYLRLIRAAGLVRETLESAPTTRPSTRPATQPL